MAPRVESLAATAICGGKSKQMTDENFSFDSIEGALTPEQATLVLNGVDPGDTAGGSNVPAESGGAPTSTAASSANATTAPQDDGKAAASQQGAVSANADAAATGGNAEAPDSSVVMARDGKHTIPYAKLQEARQGEQFWKAKAEEAEKNLSTLQAEAKVREDAGHAPTKTDNMVAQAEAAIESGVDPELFGDFSEKSLAAGINKLVQQRVSEEVSKAIAPLQSKQAEEAQSDHLKAIYSAHPNADSLYESQQFKDWVNAHPSAVRSAYWSVFDPKTGGSADQVIEVFDAFVRANEKLSSNPLPPAAAKQPDKPAAAAAVERKPEAPMSLSSIPGGHAVNAAEDAVGSISALELYAALEEKTPAQIEAFLNRQM